MLLEIYVVRAVVNFFSAIKVFQINESIEMLYDKYCLVQRYNFLTTRLLEGIFNDMIRGTAFLFNLGCINFVQVLMKEE